MALEHECRNLSKSLEMPGPFQCVLLGTPNDRQQGPHFFFLSSDPSPASTSTSSVSISYGMIRRTRSVKHLLFCSFSILHSLWVTDFMCCRNVCNRAFQPPLSSNIFESSLLITPKMFAMYLVWCLLCFLCFFFLQPGRDG